MQLKQAGFMSKVVACVKKVLEAGSGKSMWIFEAHVGPVDWFVAV